MVYLLAEFDPIMSELLNDEKNKNKYLSWKIQNELIDILASSTRNLLCEDIKRSQWFSIIMDSTLDITKTDQVSIVIRYVILDYETRNLTIEESFLSFFCIQDHGAKNDEQLITNVILELELDINMCRGQGYNGAAVMKGFYSSLQKRIKDKVPNASYIHCCAHNLKLVILDAVKSNQKVQFFFYTVQAVINFFSSSAPRWATLAFGEGNASKIKQKILKKVCSTRWESPCVCICLKCKIY